ncbi:MAG TPA: formimidoylglutamase [Chitinophagaceae bacterium]|jgi:formiminoglutamase|nr:formimidoylglutamase [Chitinophagaceae bacterium]HPH25034.1 formimidoylglutamase [Chitinophagaceae bacterium]
MKHFKFYDKQEVLAFTKIRKFETKLGERIRCISPGSNIEEALNQPSIKYVLFGIPEDIGVKANNGMGGADSAWHPFLKSFLNIQSNDFLDGNEVLLLGQFDFSEIANLIDQNADNYDEKLAAYRRAVSIIDDAVEQLMHVITQNKKMPIVIGGGHNNAYPCVKGAAKGWYKAGILELAQINVLNLDAHADYRPLEGRHSGNAFRYAEEDGYLEKYCVLGLHENYIQQNVWMDMVNNPFIDCITYEDIFLHEKRTFMQAIAHGCNFTSDTLVGIELDVDCIEHTLSSATSPVGITANHARQYIHFATADSRPAYLHICEGATHLSDGRTDVSTGKLISYLVSDFLKAMAL